MSEEDVVQEPQAPEEWAIVEIMGHHQTAGRIQEITRFGAQLLRVDRPDPEGGFRTEFYGGQAIYRLRPCTEDIARRYSTESLYDDRPVRPLDYRERETPALPPITHGFGEDGQDDDRPF